MSQSNSKPSHRTPTSVRTTIKKAASAAEPVIRSVDRVLHPENDTSFVVTCGGLSRLRAKSA